MNSITDVGGIRVGHYQRLDPDASLGAGWACGVTVVLPPPGTVGAVDCRGGAPGTRETDLLGRWGLLGRLARSRLGSRRG